MINGYEAAVDKIQRDGEQLLTNLGAIHASATLERPTLGACSFGQPEELYASFKRCSKWEDKTAKFLEKFAGSKFKSLRQGEFYDFVF